MSPHTRTLSRRVDVPLRGLPYRYKENRDPEGLCVIQELVLDDSTVVNLQDKYRLRFRPLKGMESPGATSGDCEVPIDRSGVPEGLPGRESLL